MTVRFSISSTQVTRPVDQYSLSYSLFFILFYCRFLFDSFYTLFSFHSSSFVIFYYLFFLFLHSFIFYSISLFWPVFFVVFRYSLSTLPFSLCTYRPAMTLTLLTVGSITSPWCWCSPTAVSTLSSTPPSTARSSRASDDWRLLSPNSRSRFRRNR